MLPSPRSCISRTPKRWKLSTSHTDKRAKRSDKRVWFFIKMKTRMYVNCLSLFILDMPLFCFVLLQNCTAFSVQVLASAGTWRCWEADRIYMGRSRGAESQVGCCTSAHHNAGGRDTAYTLHTFYFGWLSLISTSYYLFEAGKKIKLVAF